MNRRDLLKSIPFLALIPSVRTDEQPPSIGQIPVEAIDDPWMGAPICAVFSRNGYCGARLFGKSSGGKSSYEGDAQETIRHLKKLIKWLEGYSQRNPVRETETAIYMTPEEVGAELRSGPLRPVEGLIESHPPEAIGKIRGKFVFLATVHDGVLYGPVIEGAKKVEE